MKMKFKELNVSEGMIKSLTGHGIDTPTKVQEQVIPLILNKKDVIVQSETGSGKTISFAVPTIELIKHEGKPQVIVVAPTRELAIQISDEYHKLSKHKDLGIAAIYGGVSYNPQIEALMSADIIIGTPGRILDLMDRGNIDLSNIKFTVLDEADRLLDMGFIDDINKIITAVPNTSQHLMFSATIGERILNLTKDYMNEPEQVLLNNVLSNEVMTQFYYDAKTYYEKMGLLVHFIKGGGDGLKLVFCNTKSKTMDVARVLRDNGIKAGFLNGNMTQASRDKQVRDFINKYNQVLVATDIAARGLDIDGITQVINFDMPREAETYSHRIGRTARNGNKGTAITLLSEDGYRLMDVLINDYNFKISKGEREYYQKITINRDMNQGRRRSYNRSY